MPDLATGFATDPCGGELLPLSPFDSLKYHFGMLLGVDDFETEQAYHRAKMRLHNAWLHRQGVVWGFGVTVDDDRGEIRVKPGLALDAAGHELHLDVDYCINVSEWFDKHENDPGFNLDRQGFATHVVICFKACLNHQVPTLLEPCDNGGTGTTYARVHETINIELVPGPAPAPVYPYHRLRVLFGIDAPKTLTQLEIDELEGKPDDPAAQAELKAFQNDKEVTDEITRIEGLPADERAPAWVAAFHRFAALDEIDLQPATSDDGARLQLFPAPDNQCLALADVNDLKLTKQDDKWILSGGLVDPSVRPSHVATTTIQDLLCGRLGKRFDSEADAGGPRIDPTSVVFSSSTAIMFTADKPLLDASVTNLNAYSVTWFDSTQGWQTSNITNAAYGGDETPTVTLTLDSAISGRVRLIVSGSGRTPLLGADLLPLAGAVDGPPVNQHDGRDFVYMKDFVAAPVDPEDPEKEQPVDDGNNSGRGSIPSRGRPKPKRKTSRK
jgi:hypothetical protein